MFRDVQTASGSDDDFDLPDDLWDDVPEAPQRSANPIPELMDTPLVRALPELEKLADYGGNSYEANLKLAAARADLVKKQLRDVLRMQSSDPFGLRMSLGRWDSNDVGGVLGARITDVDVEHLVALAGQAGWDLRSKFKPSTRAYDLGTRDFAFFLEFLRNDDPSKSVDQIVDDALRTGVDYFPNESSIVPDTTLMSVRIPLKADRDVDGKVVKVSSAVDVTEYRRSLENLATFGSTHSSPTNFYAHRTSIRISATQADFEKEYYSISNTKRNLSTTEGINLLTREDGSELTLSDVRSGNVSRPNSIILLNHEYASSIDSTFGGPNAVSEALAHEYGHSVHRSLGILWGDERAGDLDPMYAPVAAEEISNYGNNSYQEHFAESYAKLIETGEATEGFKNFLKERLGVAKIDYDSIPEILKGNNLITSFADTINADPRMDGFTFVEEGSPNSQLSLNTLRDIAAGKSVNPVVFTVEGYFKDAQGRQIRNGSLTVKRTFTWVNGDLTVYHDYFKLPDSAQGSGLGSAFINASFDYYKSIGLRQVRVTAALENGPYMWGLMGFNFENNSDREKRLDSLAQIQSVLAAYKANVGVYGQLGADGAALAMKRDTPGLPNEYRVTTIIAALRDNGWEVSDELISEISGLLSMPRRSVTAEMIANLGRMNKKTTDKRSSSLGRYIMMQEGQWSGYKDM